MQFFMFSANYVEYLKIELLYKKNVDFEFSIFLNDSNRTI